VSGAEAQQAREALVTLRTRVDAHFDAAAARQPDQVTCRIGCDGCCAPGLTVFGVEAEAIREALTAMETENPALRQAVRERGRGADTLDRCALLVAGRCSVYAARPIICRSHGAPVQQPDGEVSHCALNYETAPPAAASVLNLEALNRPLAVMAHMFDGGDRVALAALARDEST
jgi:Fe-S-cluster containining protein